MTIHRVLLGVIGALLLGGVIFLTRPTTPLGFAPTPSPSPTPTPSPVPVTVAIEPVPVKQDGPAKITGRGFAPSESIVLSAKLAAPASSPNGAAAGSASSIALTRVQAAADGTLKADIAALPDELTSGRHTLEALGQRSGKRATAPLLVRAKSPWINLNRYAMKPDSTIGFILGGFDPRESIEVSLEPGTRRADGQPQDPSQVTKATRLTSLPADPVGNSQWAEVRVPALAPGSYSLVARGARSGQQIAVNVVVEPLTPVIQLSPWSGPPGTSVQINARGFTPGDTVQVFLGSATQPVTTVTADQYGNFWGAGPIQVPYGTTAGPFSIRFVDKVGSADVTADFRVLDTKPWLELTSWSGPPSSSVGFGGGGWAAGERVTVHLGNASGPVVAVGQADDYGWLRLGTAATVPGDATPGGNATSSITFVAVGDRSHANASAVFKIINPFAGLPPENSAPSLPGQ